MKTVLFVLLSLLVLSCATTSMTPDGTHVTIITSFSPDDAAKYDDLGVVSCEEDLISSDAPEYCRNSLRNQAGVKGANFILIEGHHEAKCILVNSQCINMTARVYKAKIPVSNSK